MRKGEVGGGIWSEESVQVLILGNSKYEMVSVNVGKYGCYGRHCVREESWLGLMVASRVSPTNDDPAVSAGVLTQAAPTWAWYSSSSLSHRSSWPGLSLLSQLQPRISWSQQLHQHRDPSPPLHHQHITHTSPMITVHNHREENWTKYLLSASLSFNTEDFLWSNDI